MWGGVKRELECPQKPLPPCIARGMAGPKSVDAQITARSAAREVKEKSKLDLQDSYFGQPTKSIMMTGPVASSSGEEAKKLHSTLGGRFDPLARE